MLPMIPMLHSFIYSYIPLAPNSILLCERSFRHYYPNSIHSIYRSQTKKVLYPKNQNIIEMSRKIIFAILMIVFLVTLVYASSFHGQKITNYGEIKTLGVKVFWDKNCTKLATTINWGTIEPNSLNTKILYIKNIGNTATHINLTTENWKPEYASEYLYVSWNYTGKLINPNETLPTEIYLICSNAENITTFQFDIFISASDQPTNTLPALFQKYYERIKIYDHILNYEYTSTYKILAHNILKPKPDVKIEIFMLGLGDIGIVPYFDVLMEMAYDYYCNNMNIVIINKGDNTLEITVDGKTIAITEQIDQSKVHWHDEEAYLAQKWLSFNFKD